MPRSRARDGWANRLEFHVLTHYQDVWDFLSRHDGVRWQVNRLLIDFAISKVPPRPNPLSTMSPYSSWESLTDRRFDGRHLPPATLPELPAEDRVADLFERRGEGVLCPKSTVTFAYFAQWFTDGFLRSDRGTPRDPRRNDSNHDIDLLPLYGRAKPATLQLRAHEGGRLKSQTLAGGEFPPFLFDGGVQKPEFSELSVVRRDQVPDDRWDTLFATGSDTSNSQIGFVLLNTLFLREHNRVAAALEREYTRWDDEQLFQTARNVLIVLLIKIVIEEYINHITPYLFRLIADPKPFVKVPWHRQNWMAIEFNLLYRWHALIPSLLQVGSDQLPVWQTVFDPELVTRNGLARLFEDASQQPAGRIGLFNTDHSLRAVELASVREARWVQLAPYNDYRELAKFPRVTSFDQISGDRAVQDGLRDVYGSVDRVELYPGLFAEDPRPNSVLPSLIGRLVGVDAFSQALTNPLLSPRLFNEATFSPLGMEIIRTTASLSDIVHRNIPEAPGNYFVSMTRRDWVRQPG